MIGGVAPTSDVPLSLLFSSPNSVIIMGRRRKRGREGHRRVFRFGGHYRNGEILAQLYSVYSTTFLWSPSGKIRQLGPSMRIVGCAQCDSFGESLAHAIAHRQMEAIPLEDPVIPQLGLLRSVPFPPSQLSFGGFFFPPSGKFNCALSLLLLPDARPIPPHLFPQAMGKKNILLPRSPLSRHA